MHLRCIIAMAAALAAVPPATLAQESAREAGRLPYTYAELAFVASDFNDFTATGLALEGSYAVGSYAHAFLEFSDLEGEFGAFDSSRERFEIGAGINWPYERGLDLLGRVSYVSVDQNVNAVTLSGEDIDGVGAEIAVRKLNSPRTELRGSIQYTRFDGGADEKIYRAGVRYVLDGRWAALFDLGYSSDNPSFSFGVRYDFER